MSSSAWDMEEGSSDEEEEEGRKTRSDRDLESDSDSELHQGLISVERMDATQRQEFRDRGIVVREGMWTGLEDRKLKENMQIICKKYKIDDERKVMYPDDYDDGAELRKLIREEKLLIKLGKGIQRPIYNVYIRARKIFDPRNYLGRFSSDEVQQMKALTKQFGTRWSKIGREMGRSGRALCDKFKISQGRYASGHWSEEEKEKLVGAVKELTGFSRDRNVERLYFNIPWTAVSDRMKTRNVTQCRIQWVDMISWAAAEYTTRKTTRDHWNNGDSIRLIERVYKLDVHDEQDIDWHALLEDFSSVPSPQKLRIHWHRLKVRYIPSHHFKTFEDTLTLLHDSVLPELRSKSTGTSTGTSKLRITSAEFVENSGDEMDGGAAETIVRERATAATSSSSSSGETDRDARRIFQEEEDENDVEDDVQPASGSRSDVATNGKRTLTVQSDRDSSINRSRKKKRKKKNKTHNEGS